MANNVSIAQTFERRGTVVPFVSQPSFRHTRARIYDNGGAAVLEAVVPNYSGGRRGELTVLHWKDLPGLAQFSQRDLELHAALPSIVARSGIDPLQVRSLVIKIDARLAEDGERRQAAQAQTERDAVEQEVVRMSCIAQLMRECGIERGDPVMAKANTKTLVDLISAQDARSHFDLDRLIERVMDYAAQRSGVGPDKVREWLEPLVGLITPFGTVKGAQEDRTNGFLFVNHVALMEFRKSVAPYLELRSDHFGASGDLLLKVVDQTIMYIDERIVNLDRLLGSFADVFAKQEANIAYLLKLRRDVAYALDGWTDLIDVWNEGDTQDSRRRDAHEGRDRAIAYIINFMPIIPYRELYPDDGFDTQANIERARARAVAEMHSWQTDALDVELKKRVEAGQERAAKAAAGQSF